jgi:sulfur carrier protein ThiS
MLRDVVAEPTTTLEVDKDTTLAEVLRRLIVRYGPALQHVLLDEDGHLQRSVCLSVNDAIVPATALDEPLCTGTSPNKDVSLLLIPPVFGGNESSPEAFQRN